MEYKEVYKIARANSFSGVFKRPTIVVFRNTTRGLHYQTDSGNNICDLILLIHKKKIQVDVGRSYPNDYYLKRHITGLSKCNYIATGFYPKAWRKGYHRGYKALVQNKAFMIWRSKDMELMNDDDYNEYNIVADNFHGGAPCSAGCVTVSNWREAQDWIYSKSSTFFDAIILNHEDLNRTRRLRIGSSGYEVSKLQEYLKLWDFKIKVDGDFGPMTHYAVVKHVHESGIVTLNKELKS